VADFKPTQDSDRDRWNAEREFREREIALKESEQREKSAFEREKWQAERDLRDREIALKAREQSTKEDDLALRKMELNRERWRSPLVLAILAAAIAAAGNSVVAYLNGYQGRTLGDSRAESARILEIVKTGDPDKAAANLDFLDKIGLITNPETLTNLHSYLAKRSPGQGIALPPNTQQPTNSPVRAPLPIPDQGSDWTDDARLAFYSQDQGSRIMPLAWLRALKQANGQPFLEGGLSRYGYLQNPANSDGLPVGFNASGPKGNQIVGMTCAACHTREITVEGKNYRIDGGPAIMDFQSFLADLDTAVGAVLTDAPAFPAFARAALGPKAVAENIAELRETVAAWHMRYHALISRALPAPAWGYGRLDAVSMIFNRLTGLGLGPPPSHLIADNIKPADAPVRYPFLWNASRQDKTQWAGFADSGSDILALPRNLGEVFGVFGVFEPKKTPSRLLLGYDYLNNNSANFHGLNKLEGMIKKIGPPRWPWPLDPALGNKGKIIFQTSGKCADCHAIKPGKVQFPNEQTWATPLSDVGTDFRQYRVLARKAQPGELLGARIPTLVKPLADPSYAVDILAVSVLGSILQNNAISLPSYTQTTKDQTLDSLRLPASSQELQNINKLSVGLADAKPVYEARVLQGVWAAAPYLHNGSVPTLKDLLKPAAERPQSFNIGPSYDLEAVGLALEQPAQSSTLNTTDCGDLTSGNSRCGHEYGTQLPDEDKKALLEYLKTL
jgi:hypothetical protein